MKVGRPGVKVAARRGYVAGPMDPHAIVTSSAPAVPSIFDEALGRLARVRDDTQLFTSGVATRDGLDIVAELAEAVVGRSGWEHGASVAVTAVREGESPVTAVGSLDPGVRGLLVHVPVNHPETGTWRVTVRASAGESAFDARLDVAPPGAPVLLGEPMCYRGTASARVALRPVASFVFTRAERVHVEWPVLKTLDQRSVRTLDSRGQPLALGATVTEQDKNNGPVAVVDVNLAPLAE